MLRHKSRTSLQPLLDDEDSETEFHSWREYQEHIRNPINKTYPCPLYVWMVLRNTSRAERLSCALAALALVLCTALVLYFTLVANKGDLTVVDRAPHEWNITREDWLARPEMHNDTVARFAPLKLVVVQHTVSAECHRFTNCAAELRNLQNYFMDSQHLGYDIPYNYLIGNDGRVYQGRGWNMVGAHTYGFNRCSLGVAFIGDYREELLIHSRVTDLQLQRFNMLLEDGVRLGFLRPDYSILPARDVRDTASPGSNLYRELQKMEHYERTYNFYQMQCEGIYDKLGDYREELPIHSRVTDLQLQRFNMLLEEGVRLGFLRPDYSILPARDIQDSASPGSNLYRKLQKMEHYERTYNYFQMRCEGIYDKLGLPYEL